MPKKKTRRKKANESESGIKGEISRAMKNKKLLMGSNTVTRSLKNGGLKLVIFATNIPEASRKDIGNYVSVSDIEAKEFKGNSAKLGETCGKPFSILMVGIKK